MSVIEVDLAKIKQIAQQKEDENWEFRAFLKGYCRFSSGKIDQIVRELYREVSAAIDCTQCGNCCRVSKPILKQTDIKRLARELTVSSKQFKSQYLTMDDGEKGFAFNLKPCPFLRDNKCVYYTSRPGVCKSFPHLHKKDFVFRLIRVVENYAICPIVFNVYERLKGQLWRNRRSRYG